MIDIRSKLEKFNDKTYFRFDLEQGWASESDSPYDIRSRSYSAGFRAAIPIIEKLYSANKKAIMYQMPNKPGCILEQAIKEIEEMLDD